MLTTSSCALLYIFMVLMRFSPYVWIYVIYYSSRPILAMDRSRAFALLGLLKSCIRRELISKYDIQVGDVEN